MLSCYAPVESGAERQAHRQARELVRRGHRVTVFTQAVKGSPQRETIDGVDVRRCIRPIKLGPAFGLTFLGSLGWALWRSRRQLDVVHCHQALWEAVGAGAVATRCGLPTVVQPAAGGPYGEIAILAKTKGRRLLRKAILRNTRFVAISEQIEAELRQLGVDDGRLDLFASGVDVEEFSPGHSALENQLPPRPRVVFLGRLHPQKNLPRLLEAWNIVCERSSASLLLIGDGPQRENLTRLADGLNYRDSVHFIGESKNPLDYLRAADVFVLPSLSEGMSNSLLEAMACGLPSVVSRAGGNVDLVRHERTGLVADASDAAQLAQALTQMLDQPALRESCGKAARELICEN